jgi:FtsP/CotA-like multicopper oxidase with cupredoxin domain
VIAVDGNAVTPFAFESWRLGPAMRLELSLRTPPEGGRIALLDYFAAEPVRLATLVARGSAKRSDGFTPVPLKPVIFPEPDLATGRRHRLSLGSSAEASVYPDVPPVVLPDGTRIDLMDSLCATTRTFWAIDGKTWPQGARQKLPPPFARFARGQTVILDFVNDTKQPHPMHLHGHSFKVLECSRLRRPVHWADTVLVMADERVQIAFVADNPGNWMIHCHIIEHQDTGMMAWFAVA